MVSMTHSYTDTILAFYGYIDLFIVLLFFFIHLHCLVGCLSMIVWTHVLFWVSNMHVFYILVFVLVQHDRACFTQKGALEIQSLLLSLLLSDVDIMFNLFLTK